MINKLIINKITKLIRYKNNNESQIENEQVSQ